jgi:hypothetical protein
VITLLAAIGHGLPLLLHGSQALQAIRIVEDLKAKLLGPIEALPDAARILFEELSGQLREVFGRAIDSLHERIGEIRQLVGNQVWEKALINPLGFIANRVCHGIGCCSED